jgi:hypothetical protein
MEIDRHRRPDFRRKMNVDKSHGDILNIGLSPLGRSAGGVGLLPPVALK